MSKFCPDCNKRIARSSDILKLPETFWVTVIGAIAVVFFSIAAWVHYPYIAGNFSLPGSWASLGSIFSWLFQSDEMFTLVWTSVFIFALLAIILAASFIFLLLGMVRFNTKKQPFYASVGFGLAAFASFVYIVVCFMGGLHETGMTVFPVLTLLAAGVSAIVIRQSEKKTDTPSRTGVIRDFDIKAPSVKIGQAVVYVVCGIIVVVSIFPVFWVSMAGFKDLTDYVHSTSVFPQSFNLSRYVTTWNQLNMVTNYLNSFYVIIGSVASAVFFNGLLAYGLAILKPRGYKYVNRLVMLSLLIPATISLVPLFLNIQHFNLHGFFTPLWLAAGANAFFVILFRQFFESLPPSILEAGKIDGCTQMQTFYMIVMPLSKPICVVIIIFAVNGAWSDFFLPYLLLRGGVWQTVMVRLYEFSTMQTTSPDDLMRAVVFSMIPPIILFFIFQKKLTENIVTVGIKG
jgi:multiple sugar transport system permease protein